MADDLCGYEPRISIKTANIIAPINPIVVNAAAVGAQSFRVPYSSMLSVNFRLVLPNNDEYN